MIPLVPGVHVLFVSFLSRQFEYIHTDKSVFLKFEHLFFGSFGLEYEDVAGGFWTTFPCTCTNLWKLLVSVTYVTGLVKNCGKSRLSEVWVLALKGRGLTQASRKQRRWTFRKSAVSCCHTMSTFKDLIDLLQWVTFCWQLTFRTLEAPHKEAIQHGCDTKLHALWWLLCLKARQRLVPTSHRKDRCPSCSQFFVLSSCQLFQCTKVSSSNQARWDSKNFKMFQHAIHLQRIKMNQKRDDHQRSTCPPFAPNVLNES